MDIFQAKNFYSAIESATQNVFWSWKIDKIDLILTHLKKFLTVNFWSEIFFFFFFLILSIFLQCRPRNITINTFWGLQVNLNTYQAVLAFFQNNWKISQMLLYKIIVTGANYDNLKRFLAFLTSVLGAKKLPAENKMITLRRMKKAKWFPKWTGNSAPSGKSNMSLQNQAKSGRFLSIWHKVV